MAPIPKKAMLPSTLQNSRGIMCANVAGKVVAKAVRSKLVGPLAVEAEGRQHGAVPRGGTEFPSHACRLFLKEAALSTLLFRSWLWEPFRPLPPPPLSQ